MSAAVKLSAYDVEALARFLNLMNEATRITQVNACHYDSITVTVGEGHGIRVNWDRETEQYVVNDQVGL